MFGAEALREFLGEALGETAELEEIRPHGRGFLLRLDLGEDRRDHFERFSRGMDGEGGEGVATDDCRARFGRQAAERVERGLLTDGAKGADRDLAEGVVLLAAGEVADLRDELHELPLAGEAEGRDEEITFGLGAEQLAEAGEVTGRTDVTVGGFDEGEGDAMAGGRLQGGVVHERTEDQRGFFGGAGLADEFDPWTGAGGVNLAADEEALHVRSGDAGVDRLHDRVEFGFMAFHLGRLGGDVLEPRTGEFVDARPGGEIEEGVLGVLREMRKHGAGAFRSADAGEGAMRFETDAGIGMGEERCDEGDVRRSAGAEGFA